MPASAEPREMPGDGFVPPPRGGTGAAEPRDMPPFPPMGAFAEAFGGLSAGASPGPAGGDSWPPFPPMGTQQGARGDPASPPATGIKSPKLPCASPVGNIACPIGQAMSPNLTTPAWSPAKDMSPNFFPPASSGGNTPGGGPPPPTAIGGLSQIDSWAWEIGSDVGSVPSAWSKATSSKTGRSGASRMSSASGVDGLIPGLVDGQRLSAVKPNTLPQRGGKVIVSLRKEVPQGYWDTLSIVLVNLPVSLTLKPTGIKKGKKLCIEVPPGMKPDDYDVRLKFGEKIIHGSIPLSIRDDDEEASDMDDDDLKDLASDFKTLIK